MKNSLLTDHLRFGYALTTIILVVFLISSGIGYYLGRIDGTFILLACAVFFPIYFLTLTIALARFRIPDSVAILDDGVVLHYHGERTRRIPWVEVQALRMQGPIKSTLGKKQGDILQFVMKKNRISMNVDNNISESLKNGYRSWCSMFGHIENVVQEKKLRVEQILAGEGEKVRGWATIVFGIVVGSVALVLAYIFIGLDNTLFDALVLMIVISGSGFFVFFGVADILSDVKYVKIAVVTAFGGLIPVAAFLAIGTLRIGFMLSLALVVAGAVWAYFLVWRRFPRETALDE